MYDVRGYESIPKKAMGTGAFLKRFQDEQAIVDWLRKVTNQDGYVLIDNITIV